MQFKDGLLTLTKRSRPKQLKQLKTLTNQSSDDPHSLKTNDLERKLVLLSKQNDQLSTLNQYLQQSVRRRDEILEVERKLNRQRQLVSQKSPIPRLSQSQMRSSSQKMLHSSQSRVTFQYDDALKISQILDLELPDEDAKYFYDTDYTVTYLKQLDEEAFMKLCQEANLKKQLQTFECIQRLLQLSSELFSTVLRLKRVIKSSKIMQESVQLDSAISSIVEQTRGLMNCDRVSCFIVDESKGEMWSKVAQGVNSIIRLPIDQGIVGYVASKKEALNIPNAYSDERFSREHDQRNNYKTNTILAAPILTERGACLGVLQCVNKDRGYFTNEDLSYLKLLCRFSSIALNNSWSQSSVEYAQNKLRLIVSFFLELQGEDSVEEIINKADYLLKKLMNVGEARTAIRMREGVVFWSGEKLVTLRDFSGIFKLTIASQEIQSVLNCSQHPYFDPHVDLDTQMPTICVPINENSAFMVMNMKGVQKRQSQSSGNAYISNIELEMLEYVQKILRFKLISLKL